MPAPDPVSDLALDLGRHSYGSNLATAILFSQQDSAINHENEDRFQVSGVPGVGRYPPTVPAQKAAGLVFLSDLIALWFPVASRPRIVSIYIPRRYVTAGSMVLPPLIYIFTNCVIASQIRKKLLDFLRSTTVVALRKVWVVPVLTRASHVRIDILNAIRRVLSETNLRCSVQSFGRSPNLHVTSGGRERVFSFVSACEFFGHMVTHENLAFAYRTAGRAFNNRLAATFLILLDGSQPLVSFTVPTPRVTVPVTAPAPVVVSGNLSTPVPALPVPTYLQRTLSAPIASGSGSARKRPAESSSSDFANATSSIASKRLAP